MGMDAMDRVHGVTRVGFVRRGFFMGNDQTIGPSPEDRAIVRFFGRPGDESRLVSLDVTGLGVKYDGQAV
jgi:hypothetical protein